jgi:non-specific serine/threonine protein kinase
LRVLDAIESLLDKSIILREDSNGVAMFAMRDTVRDFGLDVAAPEDREQARVRHRDLCLERLASIEARWYGPDQAELLELCRRGLPGVRAAMEFCIERGDGAVGAALLVNAWRATWQANGRFDELRRWATRILALGSPETSELCQMRAIMCTVEFAQGDLAACSRHLEQAQEVAEHLKDPLAEAMVIAVRGYLDPDPAAKVAWFTRSLELQGGSNLLIARADIEGRFANAHDLLGETETAAAMRSSLAAEAILTGERYDTANMLMHGGIHAIERGELDNATALLRHSLTLCQGLGIVAYQAITEEALAVAANLGQDYTRAATLLGAAQSVWGSVGPGAAFSPVRHLRSDAEAETQRMLGPSAFAAAFGNGQEFSLEQGIAYALGASARKVSATSRETPSGLSARESQVAALVGRGLSDKEIAETFVISRRTAEGHVAKSLMKLGFTSRSQLGSWAARRGEQS